MLIDWFTVGAQIINFLILVLLLKRFLFRPILKAMDEREQKIAANLENAAAAKVEAEREKTLFQDKTQALQQQTTAMLKKAEVEADQKYQTLLEEAKNEVKKKQAAWYNALENEQQAFLNQLEAKAQQEVFAVARQTLADLAGADLEEQMVHVFIRKFKEFVQDKERNKEETAGFLYNAENPLLVRSAFPLSAVSRQSVEKVLQQEIPGAARIIFQVAPEMAGGLELAVGGQKVSWTIGNYLSSLRQSMKEILERKKNDNVARS
ncbi:MAG TPA: hypothetical protein PKA28_08135 [Methylomusa anaerophila]|uniref:ATP synthase subunit b n=1 Tax=Methylomusa anaerophila TaxID=1930071 RepID=A0A348ALB9_9FIRM|nr:F0F1 ATP synthase subunit B [Methylomusa anaerophila]BBB91867.1 ATP synthase subunit b, sodium ion specific [Methylomusa anaerophila]HML88402.1 hypothetical protein [Methylomusa anaerophila]